MAQQAIDPGEAGDAVTMTRATTPGTPSEGSDVFLDARPFTPLTDLQRAKSPSTTAMSKAPADIVSPSPSRLSNLTLTPEGASAAANHTGSQEPKAAPDDDTLAVSPPFSAVDEAHELEACPSSSGSLPPPLHVRADSLRSSDPLPSKAILEFRSEAGGSGPSRSHSNASSSAPSSSSNAAAAANSTSSEHETGSSLGRSGSWASTVPTSPEIEIANAPLPAMGAASGHAPLAAAAKELDADADAELGGLSPTTAVGQEEVADVAERNAAAATSELRAESDDSESAGRTPVEERRPRAALKSSEAGSAEVASPSVCHRETPTKEEAAGAVPAVAASPPTSSNNARDTIFVPSDFARGPRRELSVHRQDTADLAPRPGAVARLQIRSEEHLISSSDESHSESHSTTMTAAASGTLRARNGRPPLTAPSAWRDKPLPPLQPQPESPGLGSDIPDFIRQFYAGDGSGLEAAEDDPILSLDVPAPLPSLRLEESQAFRDAVAGGSVSLKPPMSQANASQASSLGSHSGGSSPSISSHSPTPAAIESSPRRNGFRQAFSRKYLWRQSLSGEALEAAAAAAAKVAADLDSPRIEVDEAGGSSSRQGLDGKRPSLQRRSIGSQLSAVDGVGTAMTRLSSASSVSGVSSGEGRADSVAPLPSEGNRSRPSSRGGGLFHRHSKVAPLTNATQESELRSTTPKKESSHAYKSSLSKRFSLHHDAGGWSMKKSASASPDKAGQEDKRQSSMRPSLSRKSTRSIDGLAAVLSRDADSGEGTSPGVAAKDSSPAALTPDEPGSGATEMDRKGSKSSTGHRRHRSQDAAAFLSRGMSFLGSGSHTVKGTSSSSSKRDLTPESRRDEAWWEGDVAREASPRAPEIAEFAAATASLSARPSEATLRPSKLPVPSAKGKASSSSSVASNAGSAQRSFKSFFEPLRKGMPGSSRPSSPAISERTSSRQARPMTSLGFGGRSTREASSRPNALTSDSIKSLTASRGAGMRGGRSVASSAVSDATYVTALTTISPVTGGRAGPRTVLTPAATSSSRSGAKGGDSLTPAPREKSSGTKVSAAGRAASALGHVRPKTAGGSTVSAPTAASRAKAEAASRSSASSASLSKRLTNGASEKSSAMASFAAEPSPPPRSTSAAAGLVAKRRSVSNRASQVPPSSPSRHFAAAAASGMLPTKSTPQLETAPVSRSGSLRPSLTVDTLTAAPSASDSALVTDDSPDISPAPQPAPTVKRKFSQPTLSIIDDRDFLQALEDVRQQHRERAAARRDSDSKTAMSPRLSRKKDLSPAGTDVIKRPSLKRDTHDVVGVTPRRPRALSADGRLISPGLSGAEFFSVSPTSSRGDGTASGSPQTPRASPQRELPQTPLERGVGRASGKLGESALNDDGDWKKEVKALFVIRELVQTERSYARHLEGLLQAVNRTAAPEPHPSLAARRRSTSGLLTLSTVSSPNAKPASRGSHLAVMRKLIPQLIALSRALATSIDENPTAAGVGLAFRVVAPQLEASFLAWSEAVEGVMAALRYTEGPKGVKSRDRLGLITLPPTEDGTVEPATEASAFSTVTARTSTDHSSQRRRASGPAESLADHQSFPGSPEILASTIDATPTPSTSSSTSRNWKRRSTITTPSSAAAALAVVKAEAAAAASATATASSAADSQMSFEESTPVETPSRSHSAWGFASKRAFGTAGSSTLTRPAHKERSATMAPTTPSNGRKALSALDIAIMPTQRLPRYLLLLRDLIANTPPASLTYARCAKALDILRHVAKVCDEASSSGSSAPGKGGAGLSSATSASRSLTASSASLDTTSVGGGGPVTAALKARPIWR